MATLRYESKLVDSERDGEFLICMDNSKVSKKVTWSQVQEFVVERDKHMVIKNLKRLWRYLYCECVNCGKPISVKHDYYCSQNCCDVDGKWGVNTNNGSFITPRLFNFD